MVSENLVFRSRSHLPRLSLAAILVAGSGLAGCKDKKQPPPQAVRGADQSGGWVIEEDTTAPELNAASLMQIKGIAVYRASGTMVPARNTVAEVVNEAVPGARTLIAVSSGTAGLVTLASVLKNADGTLPAPDDSGAFPPEAAAEWVVSTPFAFGGAAWDDSMTHVLYVDQALGDTIATSPDGTVDKVAYQHGTLNVAVRGSDGVWAAPVALAQGAFDNSGSGVPLVYSGAAVWTASIGPVAGYPNRERVVFGVDRLVDPSYTGTDRDPADGRYAATFEVSSDGSWTVVEAPVRIGNFGSDSFHGYDNNF
jgi:hypothetical protein